MIRSLLIVAMFLSMASCVNNKIHEAARRHKQHLIVLHRSTVPHPSYGEAEIAEVNSLKANVMATAEEIERLSQ